MPSDLGVDGRVSAGAVVRDCDLALGSAANNYGPDNGFPIPDGADFVTRILQVEFTEPLYPGDMVAVSSTVEGVSASSVTVGGTLSAKDLRGGEFRLCANARAVMVCAKGGQKVLHGYTQRPGPKLETVIERSREGLKTGRFANLGPHIIRIMLPADLNPFGKIFGGVIAGCVDDAAHVYSAELKNVCGSQGSEFRFVTRILQTTFVAPVEVGDHLICYTKPEHVLHYGETSIIVVITVASRRRGVREMIPVAEGEVLLVAVNEKFKPIPHQLDVDPVEDS